MSLFEVILIMKYKQSVSLSAMLDHFQFSLLPAHLLHLGSQMFTELSGCIQANLDASHLHTYTVLSHE